MVYSFVSIFQCIFKLDPSLESQILDIRFWVRKLCVQMLMHRRSEVKREGKEGQTPKITSQMDLHALFMLGLACI